MRASTGTWRSAWAQGAALIVLVLFGPLTPALGEDEAELKPVRLKGLLAEGRDGRWRLETPTGHVPVVGDPLPDRRKTLMGIPLEVVALPAGGGIKDLHVVSTEPGGLLKTWQAERHMLTARHDAALVGAFERLDGAFLDASAGVAGSGASPYAAGLQRVTHALADALHRVPGDENLFALARQVSIEQRIVRKSRYRQEDVYHPHVYLAMYQQSRGGCALVNTYTARVYGSGVLVGKDVVLTCHHCLWPSEPGVPPKLEAQHIKARFDFEQTEAGETEGIQHQVTAVLAEGKWDGGADYALLRIAKDERGNLPEESRIRPLSTRAALRHDALYVVGHPNGETRQVADSCYVMFPYEVNRKLLDELTLEVAARVYGSADAAARFQQFQGSYRQAGTEDVFRHLSRKFDGCPTIGADCDTSHGNSGSAVFLKATHQLVGIVFAGEEDQAATAAPYEPGWTRHEGIVPTTAILEDLRAQRLDPAALGVVIR